MSPSDCETVFLRAPGLRLSLLVDSVKATPAMSTPNSAFSFDDIYIYADRISEISS